MEFLELDIPGAWVFTPDVHADGRGAFLESFTRASLVSATRRSLQLAQANISKSVFGTVRGLHFATVPPGQAKYVQCISGAAYDVVVDIRSGSPTFGQWSAVTIDDENHQAVFISEGLAHGFAATSPNTTLAYFCSEPYQPASEFSINPFDKELQIRWPIDNPIVSDRDRVAPSLAEAAGLGLLPNYAECCDWIAILRANAE